MLKPIAAVCDARQVLCDPDVLLNKRRKRRPCMSGSTSETAKIQHRSGDDRFGRSSGSDSGCGCRLGKWSSSKKECWSERDVGTVC
ncbi:transposase [Anopheles sinensis]|uniref:Transposase n=1 Tax=Anopheles sinensis TaxID=74873 RepID=A0A084WTG4_ANOSI|nr:transposase [Anopheles sinensis]